MYWDVAGLPFTMGSMGLRSAVLTSGAAYWSSWADCLEKIAARNPSVADMIVTQMDHEDAGFLVSGAAAARTVGENWFRRSRLAGLASRFAPTRPAS